MPSHSRSRARYGGRDSDYEQEYARRPLYRGDDDDDDDLEEDYRPDRRYRRDRPHRSRREARGYESPVESPVDRRGDRSKAKESPATSPIKKKDRERDRDGHRRQKSHDQYGSPTRELRDRSQRERDERRERHRDVDAHRRHRRRERGREAAASKHQSNDSTNSGSHLLSADSLAKLGLQHEEEDRFGPSHAADEVRRERRRQKKRPLLDEHTREPYVLPEEPPRISKGRVASGAYLEEGRSPGTEFRRRGGGPPMGGRWHKEGWDSSTESADNRPIWKRKKWWIALAVLIVLLAIIIPVAVVFSKKHKASSDDSDPADPESSPSNSNLDSISRNSIPVSLFFDTLWHVLTI